MSPARLFVAFIFLALTGGVCAAPTARYTLKYTAEDTTMQVALCLAQAAALVRFEADEDAPQFLDALRRDTGLPLTRDDNAWIARDWRAGECLRYTAALGRIAAANRMLRRALTNSDLLVDPQIWLLQAANVDIAQARVELPAGYAISTPWRRLPSSDGALHFTVPHTPVEWAARIGIGRFTETSIALEGGVLHVALFGEPDAQKSERLLGWLRRVAKAAVSAYGRLALPDVQVLVLPVGAQSEAVVFGQSTRGQGNALTLFVDPAQSEAAFNHDWVAVHELSHLFHPYLGDRGAWLAEGLATYYQNVLRARAGLLTADQAWEQLDHGFTRGRRETHGDSTLEAASAQMGEHHDYQRIYWSGTAYWLVVDVELRHASRNRLSVDEALRRFDACCLPSSKHWAPDEFVAKLDALIGSHVFSKRFREYRARRDFPGLAAPYAALAIHREGAALRFGEGTAEAGVRDAIMRAAPASPISNSSAPHR
ncbi:MAG: hypothetical protein ABIR10_03555 [Dokdonella sp.]